MVVSLIWDDCPVNSDHFGRSSNQHGEGAYPKAKLVGLVEIGTRAAFAVSIGKYEQSENELAMNVLSRLKPGMLCIADRLFMSFEIFDTARKTGADLLFRARADRALPRDEVLPDGSYMSRIYHSKDRRQENPLTVRVIDFYADVTVNGATTVHPYKLITTLFDYKRFSFDELANLYRERWEIENMLDEVKTHLMNGEPLRSRTPELVMQEIYGMLMAHYCIRAVMYEAAAFARIDPDQLSFTHSKKVIERNVPKVGTFSP